MGFLDKIKSIFFGPDYDKDIRNLSKRISELNAEKRKAGIPQAILAHTVSV